MINERFATGWHQVDQKIFERGVKLDRTESPTERRTEGPTEGRLTEEKSNGLLWMSHKEDNPYLNSEGTFG